MEITIAKEIIIIVLKVLSKVIPTIILVFIFSDDSEFSRGFTFGFFLAMVMALCALLYSYLETV